MAILDLQRRLAEVGRLRIGQRDGNRPTKLETFRATSQSQDLVEAVAEVYGGVVREWKPGPKEPSQWEVVTEATTLSIIVAPGQVLSQFMELWSGGGCTRRCDGQTELLSDTPCKCPSDQDERQSAAAKGQACKPTTRLSVMLRDVATIGVWRLETHGWFAATELAGAAELLELATKRGAFIPASLRLEQRTTKRDGKTNRFAVPVIDIRAPIGQVLESLGVIDTQTSLPPVAVAALPSGPAFIPVPVDELPAVPQQTIREQVDKPPTPRPVRSNASAAIPTTGVKPKPVPKSAAIIPDPDEPQMRIVDAPKAHPIVDTQTKRAQQLHIAARNGDLTEMLDDLVAHVTEGRSRSTKDVGDNEASALYDIMFKLKRGKLVAAYDPDGKLLLVEQ